MKNKYLLPFALTSLMAALSGCGGESANVVPEEYDSSTENGACTIGTEGCVQFALDYPIDGLNFTCSSDTINSFISIMSLNNGAATGSCRVGDKVSFFIKSEKDKKINLGVVDLNSIALVSTAQPPRLTILDIAIGMTNQPAAALSQDDPTVKVAMKLAKIFQALALQDSKIVEPTDVQVLYITDAMRTKLDLILSSVTAQQIINDQYIGIIKPWVDVSVISDDQAFEVVKKLITISNAAVYQPEFSLFSTSGAFGNLLSGSDGLVGCNKEDCTPTTNSSIQYLFGHFLLITDRQGYTFGSGLQWKGPMTGSLSTISGINAELIRKVKPVRMTAQAQSHWINPVNKRIDQNYQFDIADVNSQPLVVTQGRLYNDYMIAGKENFYKLLTKKTTVSAEDRKDFGKWQQNFTTGEVYKGSLDLYKIFPITYLDKSVFKSVNNVKVGESYVFPLYADLTFKFTDTTVPEVKLGIVIDENGDIRSNMKSGFTDNDMSTSNNACTENNFDRTTFIDGNDVQQYRLGTVARAFTENKTISMRMVLANDVFKKINGALVGMNTTIKTSTESSGADVVIGGALLNLSELLKVNNGQAVIRFKQSDGSTDVKWGSSLASFQGIYNTNNKDAVTPADTALAQLNGGNLELKLASCYGVRMK